MSARERLTTFATVVLVAGAAFWAWIIDERTESIATIAESAHRIELVASSTERMLAETLEAQRTPEAVANRDAARRAVQEIATIKALLCDLPELADHDGCL